MTNQNTRSKFISVCIDIPIVEMQLNHTELHAVGEEAFKEAVLSRYQGESGLLETFIEDNKLVLQWMPERIDREAEAYHQAALDFAKRKLHDKSINNWEKAINLNPDDVDYRYKMALLLYEKRRYADSISHLERAVAQCQIHYKAHLLLGMNWLKLRKISKAQHYLEFSRLLHANNVLVYLNLGAVYSIQKNFNEAIVIFEKCIELKPKETRGYLGLARIYLLIADKEKANQFFRRVIELAPGTKMAEYAQKSMAIDPPDNTTGQNKEEKTFKPINRDDQFAHGMGYYIAGQYGQSASEYKAYLQTHPNDDYAWYLFGEALLRNNKVAEATDCFKRAIRINEKRGLYYKSLGIALHLLKKSGETIQVMKKAMELGKRDGLTFTIYGSNLLLERKVDEGINHLQMAIKKNPNNPMALYYLAKGVMKHKESDRARMYLDQVMALKGDYPFKKQADELIKTLET
ncbi:tetratricopeptide repeat protein [bacterium]|nr:tetratricopeptide repeat protein [bacterium]